MRKILILVFFSGALLFGSMLTKTESAEAGWDDWKSTTVECTVIRSVSIFSDFTVMETEQGTMRRCVSGWGLCAWNGNCEF